VPRNIARFTNNLLTLNMINTLLMTIEGTLLKEFKRALRTLQDRDAELGKLAIWHSMQYTDVNTNLIGIQTTKQLEMNIDVLRNGITKKEKALLQEIQQK